MGAEDVDREIEYRRWAAERLFEHLHAEEDRRRHLERKALGSLSFLVLIAGLAGEIVQGTWVGWWGLLIAYLATLCTAVAAWLTVGVRAAAGYDPRHFYGSPELDAPITNRLGALFKHLDLVIARVERQGNEKARTAAWAQRLALVGTIAFVAAVAAGVLSDGKREPAAQTGSEAGPGR